MNNTNLNPEINQESEKNASKEVLPISSSTTGDSGAGTRMFLSEDLFAGSREILIQHGDEMYRLMITRNGKLLLQK